MLEKGDGLNTLRLFINDTLNKKKPLKNNNKKTLKNPVNARPTWGARRVRNNTELHCIKKKPRTNYMYKKYCKRTGETLNNTSSHPRG